MIERPRTPRNAENVGEAGVAKLLTLEYSRKRREAKREGLDFTLTRDEFNCLILSPCTYCGCTPAKLRFFKNRLHGFPFIAGAHVAVHGIDRANSSRGYTKENSLSCCWICNRSKCNMPLSKFEEWICRVYEHRQSWHYLIDLHRPSLREIVPSIQRKRRKEALRIYREIFPR
jgi:hypothetical protein